ncbi:MAG: S24 family peptidase [Paracoccus sp. (in: a-proteobacteria)]|nr:S24 family peptidase [Paracoccus sp. (in: a-proteobacteria)]
MVVADRLREIASDNGLNIKDFAESLDVSKRTLENYLAGINLPSGRFLTDISEKMGASPSWILTGLGSKYINGDHQNVRDAQHSSDASQFVPVTRFTVEASAGHGSLVQDEQGSGTYAYNRAFLERRGLKPNNLAVISVRGDSMAPDLHDGDLILIDRADATPDAIREGRIYVVNFDGDLYVKRIQRAPGKRLMLVSSNPAYQSVTVEGADMEGLKIIGRVVNSTHEW